MIQPSNRQPSVPSRRSIPQARTRWARAWSALEDDTFAVVDNALWAKYGGTYGAGLTKTNDSTTVRHQRMVIAIKPAGAWVIADRLVPAAGAAAGQQPDAEREFRHPWLLPSSFGASDIELSPRGFRTTLANGTNVRVRHDRPARMELYHGGGSKSRPLRYEGSAAGAPQLGGGCRERRRLRWRRARCPYRR